MQFDFSKIKGIIFDYGGTLDTGGDHWSEVIWKAWQDAGVAAAYGDFREAYVYAERELARTLHILPHHNFKDLLDIKIQIELQKLSEISGFAPADIKSKASEIAELCYQSARSKVAESAEVLKNLSKKYPLVLVSNFYGNIETILQDFGISGYFKKIIESAVVGVRKPDPAIFKMGCDALGLKPEEVLVVGDSYGKDIKPAESLGCPVLWLKGKGWTAEEDAIIHPAIIGKLEEILEFLAEA